MGASTVPNKPANVLALFVWAEPGALKELRLQSESGTIQGWRTEHTGLVSNLMRQTGSTIPDPNPLTLERAQSSAHVDAAVGMMANWDLEALEPDLTRLETEVLLVSGDNDRMIAPSQSLRQRRILPNAQLALLSDLGHLAHEEDPEKIEAIIIDKWENRSADDAS